jgi:DNA topoisomerase I
VEGDIVGSKKNSTLVIVESPAKAKTISKFLGRGYKVEASMGHVIDLPKSKLGVDIENNFEPKYITIRGKGKILNKLRKAVINSKDILLATDPDREGEAISWHLARTLNIDKEKIRIEFNEITKNAIKNAIKKPRDIDYNLVDAQQARRILDRLVGYKLSPLLWEKVRRGLSAGRVQSVTVKIICEREREIEGFTPEEYWIINAVLKKGKNLIEAKLHKIDRKTFKISNELEAKKIAQELMSEDFYVDEIKERERIRNPYPPFTTSTLQQKAASLLSFSTKKTMYLAQQLYEGIDLGKEGSTGLISYIRTDSTRISREAQIEALEYIRNKFGDDYVPKKLKQYKKSGSSQDAHEAIRPTLINRNPDSIKKFLSNDQYRIYCLIWERFLASQMPAAKYRILTIDISAGKHYLFRINGSQVIFPGFLLIDKNSNKDDILLPKFEEGERILLKEIKKEQHFTQAPSRYSEASLVKALEEQGIGRPSTYSPTISTILSRNYVEREGKYLKPTELGFIVNDLLSQYFPDVTDVEFTAQLEDRLDQIEEGKIEWRKVLSDFYYPFYQRLEKAGEKMKEVQLEDEYTDEVCEKCGRPMVVKYGRYGKFLACSGYPECKNTKPYLLKTGVKCPECEDGELIQRKSKKGRTFYGCSNYPECNFVVWNKPVKKKCPKCGGLMVEKKKSGHKVYKCINKECAYEEVVAKGV